VLIALLVEEGEIAVSATSGFSGGTAIGTVADLVPLTGENRIIVRHGLSALSQPYNIGLQALLQGAGVGREVDHFDVGFKLAPRINAFTRMGGGKEIIELFSADTPKVAEAFVSEMNQKNLQRRAEEDRILAEIELRHEASPEEFESRFLVVAGDGWHRGVIGNVAARLVEKFYRPVLVLSVDDGKAQGSGRSIPGFHILKALDSCRDAFVRYGGHAQAVGCTLDTGQRNGATIQELSKSLSNYASSVLSEADLVPELGIDACLPVEQLTLELFQEIDQLAPFGYGNPVPIFSSRGVTVGGGPWILKEKHLKWRVRAGAGLLDAIWWRRATAANQLLTNDKVDLAYTLSKDSYLGEEKLLLTVKDVRASTPSL
jgi:single-stranded-DNA-specific exonuclease